MSRKNTSTAPMVAAVVAGMVGLAYASVPLYNLFCRVTGFGGTTQVATAPSEAVHPRTMKVRFNAGVSPDLPWEFKPLQTEVTVHLGENKLVFYTAKNLSDKPVVGTSIYNVLPETTGVYFNKIECFCFEEQRIDPGEEITFPVSFFIDPELDEDINLKDIRTITLSYTFFKAKNPSSLKE